MDVSRRRIVFTDNQVYFECHAMGYYEAIDVPYKLCQYSHTGRRNRANALGPREFQIFQSPSHSDVYGQIQVYSSKSFTNDNDRLNGFLGLLNMFHSSQHVRHYWGIPILPSKQRSDGDTVELRYPSSEFIKGLHFIHSVRGKCMTRIFHLPSWSWTDKFQ